jgi:hypothetical protein
MVLINGDNSTLTKVDVKETALATCVLVHHLSSMITTRLPPQAIQRSTASALPLCTVGRLSGRVDGVGRFFFLVTGFVELRHSPLVSHTAYKVEVGAWKPYWSE